MTTTVFGLIWVRGYNNILRYDKKVPWSIPSLNRRLRAFIGDGVVATDKEHELKDIATIKIHSISEIGDVHLQKEVGERALFVYGSDSLCFNCIASEDFNPGYVLDNRVVMSNSNWKLHRMYVDHFDKCEVVSNATFARLGNHYHLMVQKQMDGVDTLLYKRSTDAEIEMVRVIKKPF